MQIRLTNSLKKPMTWGAAFVAVLVALFTLQPFRLSQHSVEQRLRAAIERDSGYTVEGMGEAAFNALPWPTIEIRNLALKQVGQDNSRLDIPKLEIRLNLASWLMGNPRIVTATAESPRLRLPPTPLDTSETALIGQAIQNLLSTNKRPPLRNITVRGGIVERAGVAGAAPETIIDYVKLNVSNVASDDLRFRVLASYRGTPVTLSAIINQNSRNIERPVSGTIKTDIGEASFAGTLLDARSLTAEGFLTFTAASAPELLTRAPRLRAYVNVLEKWNASGNVRISGQSIQFRSVDIRRDAVSLAGSIDIALDAVKTSIVATLHATQVTVPMTLDSLITAAGHPDTAKFTPRGAFDILWFGQLTGDMRLSADKLSIGSVHLDNVASTVQFSGRRMELTLNEARFGKGSIKGKLLGFITNDGFDLRLTGSGDRIDTGIVFEQMGSTKLRGVGQLSAQIDAKGQTPSEILQSSKGKLSFVVRDGDIAGMDLERALVRQERSPILVALPDGRTRFQQLTAAISITGGIGVLSNSSITSPVIRGPIEGQIDFPTRSMSVVVRPQLVSARDDAMSDFRLLMRGSITNPRVLPEVFPRDRRS
jgi:AsmA protein